jgi:hypothetical protein
MHQLVLDSDISLNRESIQEFSALNPRSKSRLRRLCDTWTGKKTRCIWEYIYICTLARFGKSACIETNVKGPEIWDRLIIYMGAGNRRLTLCNVLDMSLLDTASYKSAFDKVSLALEDVSPLNDRLTSTNVN